MIFHLAIPARNLEQSITFYKSIGCLMGRRGKTYAIFDVVGSQVVLHKSIHCDPVPKMYPRHYGFIFKQHETFMTMWNRFIGEPFIFEPLFIRFDGKEEEHHTFFLKDPSNNLIEFKWYKNERAIFS